MVAAMIKKIISGGQTGADRAALDFALAHRIPHGGWVPKGRLAEDGPIPEVYSLQEMSTRSYPKRTEKNVMESDGTLIISHGPLSGGSAYTRKMAMKHNKTWFHIDLNKLPTFQASMLIKDWISSNKVETLNVAGPRASEDPLIYDLVTVALDLVHTLEAAKETGAKPADAVSKLEKPVRVDQPDTVDDAVEFLISQLSLKDKSFIAKMPQDDLRELYFSMGLYIRNKLLYPRNDKLLESCRQAAMDKYLHWDQAPYVIIRALWKRLSRTHRLRVVE
jgi:hypothetical protein